MNARHKSPSTQLMLGVSIDRSSGEGSTVAVGGFDPDFNSVLLNGRQMPTSTLGGSNGAPSSRSFDFGNLASEGIAAVEVYKSGRATLATGGIGSVINIRTARPLDRNGFQGSIGAKAVYDTSEFERKKITPEVSALSATLLPVVVSISSPAALTSFAKAARRSSMRAGVMGILATKTAGVRSQILAIRALQI